MLGQLAYGRAANSSSSSRLFRYEVTGLAQSEESDRTNYPIRQSGSVFITVPYNRMNEEMQRILRMGGKIVNIYPMTAEGNAEFEKSRKAASEHHHEGASEHHHDAASEPHHEGEGESEHDS